MFKTSRARMGRTEILSVNSPYPWKLNGSARVFARTVEKRAIRSLGIPVALVTQNCLLRTSAGKRVKSQQQLNSLREIISLSPSSGEQVQVMESIIRWSAQHMEWWESVVIFSIAVYEKPGSLTLNHWVLAPTEEIFYASSVTASEDQAATLKELLENWDDHRPLALSPDLPWGKTARELIGGEDDCRMIGFPLRTALGTWGLLTMGLASARQFSHPEQAVVPGVCGRSSDSSGKTPASSRPRTRQVRELRHEDEMRRSFISLITHEFRTPLASLKTSFELIQESEEIQGLGPALPAPAH